MTGRAWDGYQVVLAVGLVVVVVPLLIGKVFLYYAIDLVMIADPFWDAMVNGWIWMSSACWTGFVLFGICWMCLPDESRSVDNPLQPHDHYQSAETHRDSPIPDDDRYQAPAPLTDNCEYRTTESYAPPLSGAPV